MTMAREATGGGPSRSARLRAKLSARRSLIRSRLPRALRSEVFDRALVTGRFATAAVVVFAILLAPQTDIARRGWLAALFALYWLPYDVWAFVRTGRSGSLPKSAAWVDAFGLALLLLSFPRLGPYLGIAIMGNLALTSVARGTSPAVLTSGLAVTVNFIAELVRTGHPDWTLYFAFGMFLPSVPIAIAQVRANERRAHGQHQELLNGLDAVVWEADPVTLELSYVTPQVQEMFGVPASAMVANHGAHIHPADRRDHVERLRALVANGERGEATYRIVDGRGRIRWVRDSLRVKRDASGNAVVLRGVVTDVTRAQEAEALVRLQASTDSLTSLPNRGAFMNLLDSTLAERRGFAILLLDLNGFKEVNDTLGHATGDHLLKAVALRLAGAVRDRALVARLGGDEFAVLLADAHPEETIRMAASITASLEAPFEADQMRIQSAASIGIARYPHNGTTAANLLRHADAAMYTAKRTGAPWHIANDRDDSGNIDRIRLLGELRNAITEGQLRLFHQPKVDLKTGAVVGTEALLRWAHPELGQVGPVRFIEVAELSGLIQPLTTWIVQDAIRQIRAWDNMGLRLSVAINLSVQNVLDPLLPAVIAKALAEHQVGGHRLVLEITERQVMADRNQARLALVNFRKLGVRIAIDDFGTGYSSLSQLKLLSIDEIKIDTTFVDGMLHDDHDATIVRSIIELGHNLGLEVVAEGAETRAHLLALRMLGADRAQGYAIAAPMAADQLTAWIGGLRGGGQAAAAEAQPGPAEPVRPVASVIAMDAADGPAALSPTAAMLAARQRGPWRRLPRSAEPGEAAALQSDAVKGQPAPLPQPPQHPPRPRPRPAPARTDSPSASDAPPGHEPAARVHTPAPARPGGSAKFGINQTGGRAVRPG